MKDLYVSDRATITFSAPIHDQLITKDAVQELYSECGNELIRIEEIIDSPKENTLSFEVVSEFPMSLTNIERLLKNNPLATINIRNEYLDGYGEHYSLSAEGTYQVYDEEDMERDLMVYSELLYESPQYFTSDEEFDRDISIAYNYLIQDMRKGVKPMDVEDATWIWGDVIPVPEQWIPERFKNALKRDPIEFKKAIKMIYETFKRLQELRWPKLVEYYSFEE